MTKTKQSVAIVSKAIDTQLKLINKNIASIAVKGKALDDLIHTTAVMCIDYAKDHNNNFDPMTNLVKAINKASRKEALIFWFKTFAPCILSKEGNFKLDKSKTANAYDSQAASKKPFWDLTKEKVEANLKIENFVKSLKTNIVKFEKAALKDAESKARLDENQNPEIVLHVMKVMEQALNDIRNLLPEITTTIQHKEKASVTTETINGEAVQVTKLPKAKRKAA